jgi:hypothetical protein
MNFYYKMKLWNKNSSKLEEPMKFELFKFLNLNSVSDNWFASICRFVSEKTMQHMVRLI